MGHRTPGPLCSTRVGDSWIDLGTSCRSRTSSPQSTGLTEALLDVAAALRDSPLKKKFDTDHVYSLAPEAARKRDIDLQIIGDDYSKSAQISITNEDYLKKLIKLASSGTQEVSDRAKKIQFYIIRGGGEGFLSDSLANTDARNFVSGGVTTDPKQQATRFRFDLNDLLAVFDPKGKLIGAALLQRPIFVPGRWSEKTANDIYNAWDNKEVSIYKNTHPGWIPYLGLVIDDGMKKRGWVDLHKQEATNGCIFIVDPSTPD